MTENERKFHERKKPRLKDYDYGTPGYYYVTINTQERNADILSHIIPVPPFKNAYLQNNAVRAAAHGGPPAPGYGDASIEPPIVVLTPIGEMVRKYIENINFVYENARIDVYTIMPDHVHMIIQITEPGVGGPPWAAARTADLVKMIDSFKTLTAKKAGFTLWHRGYYEHIIRNDEDLYNTRNYITCNASKHYMKYCKGLDTHA